MEYDVTGTLKIDTEAFEKALKEAQKKIDSFRSDLESLGNIAKEMGFPELKKSLDDVDKSLDDIKADFRKVDKSADNVTKSVDDLKKKTDNATKSTENLKKATGDVATQGKKAEESIKTLDEYIDQATASAKNLTAETKKTGVEVDALQRKLNRLKLDKSFTKDFYKLVSQAEGTNGVELKPIYNQLKNKYKQYLKGRAEFEELFGRAVQRTNTRLYPSRNNDKNVKFKSVYDKGFAFVDRSKLVAVDEFNAKLEKVDAKIEKINAELNKPAEGLNKTEAEFKEVEHSVDAVKTTVSTLDEYFDQATASAKKLTVETKNIPKSINATVEKLKEAQKKLSDMNHHINRVEGNGASLEEVHKLTLEYEKQKRVVNEIAVALGKVNEKQNKKGMLVDIDQYGADWKKVANALDEAKKEATRLNDEHRKLALRNIEVEKVPTEEFDKIVAKEEKQRQIVKELQDELWRLRELGEIPLKFITPTKELEKVQAQLQEMRKRSSEQFDRMYNKPFEGSKKELKELKKEHEELQREISKVIDKEIQLEKELKKAHITEPFDKFRGVVFQASEDIKKESKEMGESLENNIVEGSSKATEGLKKTGAEADKLKQKLRSVYVPISSRQGLATIFGKKAQAELDKHNDFFYKTQDKIMKLKEEMTEVMGLWSDLEIKQRKAQEGLEKYGDGNRWSKKWKEDLKTIPPEIDKVKAKYESLENEVERLENEITKSGENYKKITDPLWKSVASLQKESKKLGKMISEPIKKGTSEATKDISEFDKKVAEQMAGLNDMLVESGTFTVEQAEKVNQRIAKSINSTVHQIREGISKAQGYIKNLSAGSSGLFDEASRRNKLKKEVASLNGLIEERNRLNAMWRGRQRSSDNPFTARGMSRAELERQYKKQFNQYGAGFLGDANIQKDIQKVNEFHRAMREVSASTNQWVNQEITDFNRFSKAVQTSTMEAENRLKRLEQTFATMNTVGFRNDVGIGQLFSGTGKSQNMKRMLEQQLKYNKMGNATGVGFAGTKDFQNLNRQMQEYNRLSNVANLNTQRMGLGFEKFGQYSQKATSNIRSLSGVLRTLRTTMSMIGGMFVWEFAFQIMDSARATISAKSEMESYYKTLNMGSTEIASFNKQLDNTVAKFQKMNKFQLGETISALGVEFKMSPEEMNQIMKVAPMIVNEYLRAGRSTEEAILAIKDISQGEFLRLSRETGVGKKEIKEAGWSGNNKDILSLYQALEKIGKARHWDVFAMKAQSLNDVLLITENRMTEFVTLLSDAVTPVIVGSFNALGDAFNSASQWYEGLAIPEKTYVQLGTLSAVALTTAGVFNNHLLPAIQNFGTNIVSGFLGVDSVIVKEKGLAQAIAHETAVERIANIERKGGQKVLHAKIMTLKEEELANKLGMNTTKLKMRYENLQQVAMKRGTTELKARELAQRSLILAEEENITTTQAMNILLEEEALAEMGSAKALLVKKFGLDATLVSEEGMVVAMNERIAQSFPYVASLVSQTFATLGLESATATLVVTMGLLVAPFVALGLAITPLIIQFAELQSSYERVNDVLTGGQDRIDSLIERKKELEKQEEKLANKTNRTTTESQQLDQTRKELEGTTLALKSAEEELAKAQQFDKSRTAYTTQLQANRYKNVKEINSELQKATGTNDEIISQTASMDRAYADMTKHMQFANYMENHRPERFEEFNKKLKEGSATQEEYNQKVKTFGNDWNEAYSDMESAQEKMADPELSGWDRFMAQVDFNFAEIKKDWIEFWANPWEGISNEGEWVLSGFLNIDQCKKDWEGFTNWFDDSITSIGDSWDNLWQPVTDFFNNLSVDSSFDPFAGLKGWWGDTNAWLDSIMPDISVDGIKQWFGKNVREPFQKAFSDWMKNPFGGDNKDSKGGGTATKSISLGSLFKFNFGGFKTTLTNGFKTAIGGASQVLEGAGQLWSKLGLSDGQLTVSSIKQGLVGLKTSVTNKFNEGKKAIENQGKAWGKKAYSGAKGVLDSIKRGIGNPARIVKEKLDAITNAIKNIKDDWTGAVNDAIDSFNPFNNLSFNLPFTSGGTFGYAGKPQKTRTARIRASGSSRPVYGSRVSNATFEGTLRGLLTAQGFRSPSSYQFYPNHQKSVSQTWNDGSANCFDGAMLIATLGSMMGFKSRIVNGNWNGTGHSGAMVGGKLYDMTQFQRRGVFRGTQGVHFGHSGSRHYGTSTNTVSKDMHITINMNGTVYGMADAEEKFKNIAENVFVEYHDTNKAVGV